MNEKNISMGEGSCLGGERGTKGRILECVSGRLWITFRGTGNDYILEAGDRIDLRGARSPCIQALIDSVIILRAGTRSPAYVPAIDRAPLAV